MCCIFLRGGEWRSYYPDKETGWSEYWIGFQGENMDSKVSSGFFLCRTSSVSCRIQWIHCQSLWWSHTCSHPAGTSFSAVVGGNCKSPSRYSAYRGARNCRLQTEKSVVLVNMAKTALISSLEEDVSMPEIAERLNVSYTKFRRLFKEYTGMSPAQYFINLKIHRAKEMLRGAMRQ